MRRDRAIARTAIRDLAPVHLGALGLGVLIALPQLQRFAKHATIDAWPLMALPIAALWGGIVVGGGSRAHFVHLFARPVLRLRVLAWRWLVLFAGLAIIGAAFELGLLHAGRRGPEPSTILLATLLASAFGAQGGAFAHREAPALGAALVLGATFVLPGQVALQAERITSTRVVETLGWAVLLPIALAFAAAAWPVVWMWSRDLPARGWHGTTRAILSSLVATLVCFLVVVWPTLAWVRHPERGELLGVVAVTPEGPIVATGTRGRDGERDVVDGLVVVAPDGQRTTMWNRHEEAPDSTVWRIAVPERWGSEPQDTVWIRLVDGVEPDATHPIYDVALEVGIEAEVPVDATAFADDRHFAEFDAVYGPVGRWNLGVHGGTMVLRDLVAPRQGFIRSLRAWEIGDPRSNYAVGDGCIWGIDATGDLFMLRIPWEER